MSATIDYDKYESMNRRQILNCLINAEKKEAKLKAELQEKLKNISELVKFLKSKAKAKIDHEEYKFIPFEETEVCKEFDEEFAKMSESEKAALQARVEALVNRKYDDEL